MLLDLLGADQLDRAIATLAPAVPIWDQYVSFVRWVLEELGNILGNGGQSTFSLQYAFMCRCTPTIWMQDTRLRLDHC